MQLEGFTALPECSRKVQTTPDRARYWLKLLDVETVKNGNIRYVPNSAIDLLNNMTRFISNGMTPAEAAKKTRDEKPAETATIIPAGFSNPLFEELKEIRVAMLAMAQEVKFTREENRSMAATIDNLQKQITNLLMPPVKAVGQIKTWRPEQPKDPLEGMSVFQKILVRFFRPEQMRQFDF